MGSGDTMPNPVEPAAAPDWSSLNLELSCPRCQYNLHRLTVSSVLSWCANMFLSRLWSGGTWRGAWRGAWFELRRNSYMVFRLEWISEAVMGMLPPLIAIMLTMHVFRITLVRHAVRWQHLFRIAVFAWVGMSFLRFLAITAIFGVTYVMIFLRPRATFPIRSMSDAIFVDLQLLSIALLVVSISLGYGRYLRLPRPWLGGLLTVLLAYTLLFAFVLIPRFYWSSDVLAPPIVDAWIPGAGRAIRWLLVGR